MSNKSEPVACIKKIIMGKHDCDFSDKTLKRIWDGSNLGGVTKFGQVQMDTFQRGEFCKAIANHYRIWLVEKLNTLPCECTHPAPALTAELKQELIYTIESLIEMNYAPESNCSCHISPPCNDCVDYYRAREVNEHAKSAITKLTNTG